MPGLRSFESLLGNEGLICSFENLLEVLDIFGGNVLPDRLLDVPKGFEDGSLSDGMND